MIKFHTEWKTVRAFLMSTGLAGAWFLAGSNFIDGTAGQILPIAGAIGMAAFLPYVFMSRLVKREVAKQSTLLAQKLDVLDRHVMVNIVDQNGCLVQMNEQFLNTLGFSQEDLAGEPISNLYLKGGGRRMAAQIHENLSKGQSWSGETALRAADGSVVSTQSTVVPLFDEMGVWIGSISARTDVTHLNKLLAQNETFALLDELRDDIWIVDPDAQRITYANKAAGHRMGWTDDWGSGRRMADMPDQDNLLLIMQACENLKDSDEYVAHFQSSYMDTPFNVTIKHLPGTEQSDRFLIMLNDATHQVEAERNKAELISMVSHELRSPLTSIKGSMGLLLSKAAGELPEKAVSLLEIAHRNADRLVLIINDILDLEKIANGGMDFDIQRVELNALLREAKQANAMVCQRYGIQVTIETPSQPTPVETDPNRIMQVLNNLLSNACKFSRPGGKVVMQLRDMAGQIGISVIDEGPGIPPQDQHKIFERFADLKNSDRSAKGGTGLGLSICKAIVEQLGGSIGFESQPGVGTSFYFTLPKTEGLSRPMDNGTLLSRAS